MPQPSIAFRKVRAEAKPQRKKSVSGKPLSSDIIARQSVLHNRWSATRAARVEGYVVSLEKGLIELSNCYVPCSRDIHIHVGLRPDAPPREQVVLEITPRMQEWARHQGRGWSRDWSEATLRAEMLGHWCSFEGWLFYDSHHAGEAENSAPGRADSWPATAWEVHPITNFEIKGVK